MKFFIRLQLDGDWSRNKQVAGAAVSYRLCAPESSVVDLSGIVDLSEHHGILLSWKVLIIKITG